MDDIDPWADLDPDWDPPAPADHDWGVLEFLAALPVVIDGHAVQPRQMRGGLIALHAGKMCWLFGSAAGAIAWLDATLQATAAGRQRA